jgi:hypothetical protein
MSLGALRGKGTTPSGSSRRDVQAFEKSDKKMQETTTKNQPESHKEIDQAAAEVEQIFTGAEEGVLFWSAVLRRAADRLERSAGNRPLGRYPRPPRANVEEEGTRYDN